MRAGQRLAIGLGVAALFSGGAGSLAGPITAHAAGTTFYFHGLPANGDDASRQTTATATFDTTAPTGTAPSTQTSAPALVPAPCGDSNYSYWTGPFTGTVSGSIHIDWWWQTANAETLALGERCLDCDGK